MAADATERAVRWERARLRHGDVLQAAGVVPGRAGRRLQYACLTPAGPLARLGAGIGMLGYLVWTQARGDFGLGAVLRMLALAVVFLALCTNRASVTEYGLSFDVAGLRRQSSFGFVPLYAVHEVVPGPRPADWPRGPSHGAPWPGRSRVHIRYEDAHAVVRVRSAWVRRPPRYVEAVLGNRPDKRQRRKPGGRR
jgi:hypothetical protein